MRERLTLDIDSAGGANTVNDVRRVDRAIDDLGDTGERSGRKLSGGMQAGAGAVSSLRRELAQLVSAAAIVHFGRQVVQNTLQLEGYAAALKFATGNQMAAGEALEFVNDEADRLRINLPGAIGQFTALSAAAKGTALEGQGIREVFSAVNEAGVVLNLNAQQLDRVNNAIQQIISKGKVSAEELRQQLGEQLYGAFQLSARAIGVTTSELDDLLARGKLDSARFLPAFARQLRTEFGPALSDAINTSRGDLEDWANEIYRIQIEIGESGFVDGLTDGLQGLREALADPTVRESLRETGSLIGELLRLMPQLLSYADNLAGAWAGAKVGRLAGPYGATAGAIAGFMAPDAVGTMFGNESTSQVTRDQLIARRQAQLQPIQMELASYDNLFSNPDAINALDAATLNQMGERMNFLQAQSDAIQATIDDLRSKPITPAQVGQLSAGTSGYSPLDDEEDYRDLDRISAQFERMVKEADERDKLHQRAVANIEAEQLAYMTASERMIVQARKWRDEQYQMLDQSAADYEEHAQIVEETFTHKIADAQAQALEDAKDWRSGAIRAIRDYQAEAEDVASSVQQAFSSGFQKLEDDLVKAVRTGKLEFSDLADHIINEMLRTQVIRPAVSGVTGFLGDLVGGVLGGGSATSPVTGGSMSFTQAASTVAVAHTGGVNGEWGQRQVDPSWFQAAPRFHTGVGPDEQAAIIQRTEGVFTSGQMRAMAPVDALRDAVRGNASNVKVEIIESPGNGGQVRRQSTPQGDLIQVMVDRVKGEVIHEVENGQGVGAAIERRYGLTPSGGLW